jgi:hypothetical protein
VAVIESLDLPGCLGVELCDEDSVTLERASYIAMARTPLFHTGRLPTSIMHRLLTLPQHAQVQDLVGDFSLLGQPEVSMTSFSRQMPHMFGSKTYCDTDAPELFEALSKSIVEPDPDTPIFSVDDVSDLFEHNVPYYVSVLGACLLMVKVSDVVLNGDPNVGIIPSLRVYHFKPEGYVDLVVPLEQVESSAQYHLLPQFVQHSLLAYTTLYTRLRPFVGQTFDAVVEVAMQSSDFNSGGLASFFTATVRASLNADYADVNVVDSREECKQAILSLNDAMNQIELSEYLQRLQPIWRALDKDDKLKMVYMLGRLSSWGILGVHDNDDAGNVSNNTLYRCCYELLKRFIEEYPEDALMDYIPGRAIISGYDGHGRPQLGTDHTPTLQYVAQCLRRGLCIYEAMGVLSHELPHVINIQDISR